jgi:hypothetical protein
MLKIVIAASLAAAATAAAKRKREEEEEESLLSHNAKVVRKRQVAEKEMRAVEKIKAAAHAAVHRSQS